MAVIRRAMSLSQPRAAAAASKERKYRVKLAVIRLEGLPAADAAVAAVEVSWKPPQRRHWAFLPYLAVAGRMSRRSCVSGKKPVGTDGALWWEEDDAEAARFESVCSLLAASEPGVVAGGDLSAAAGDAWDVSFRVLYGSQRQGKGKGGKLERIGTARARLSEWARPPPSHNLGQVLRKKEEYLQVPITLRQGRSLIRNATLYVKVEFMELTANIAEKGTSSFSFLGELPIERMQSTREEQTSGDSWTFEPEFPDLHVLLELADKEEKVVVYGKRSKRSSSISSISNTTTTSSSSGGSSPEPGSISKRRFFTWRKRSKLMDNTKDDMERANKNSEATTLSTSDKDDDPIGRWESKEIISRDGETKLKAQIFFASIDQRAESAGGESACTALVAILANVVHSKQLNTLTKSEFDALIREGSSEWRNLCDNDTYKDHFPNKHFDLDTVLDAKLRPISVLHEQSFVGFFQPESFESLSGAMSFDDIWHEISCGSEERKGKAKVYIVSWNDHFFVLKAESNAYYIIDTLGERLSEGCNKAYILKFDDASEMYRLSVKNDGNAEESIIITGKESCREFINRFLAAIPLREELEIEKKGAGAVSSAPHQRLQIEFHYTSLIREEAMNDGRL